MFGELSFTASAGGYAELQRWAETLTRTRERPVFGIEGAEAGAHGSASTCSVPAIASSRASVRVEASDAPASPTASTRSPWPSARSATRSTSTPRSRGILSALRALLVARRSTVAERTRVLNQLRGLNATAPVRLRERIGDATDKQLERRDGARCAGLRADVEERVVFGVIRDLAARSRAVAADARHYEQ